MEVSVFRKLVSLFLLISNAAALCLAACERAPQSIPTPSNQQLDAEEQAVYAVLVKDMFPSSSMLVVMDTTATDAGGLENTEQTLQHVLANMHGVASQTVQNFKNRNASATLMQADMDLGVPYVLLSQDAMNQIFSLNQDGWQAFYSKYPQAPGILTFSRAGFDDALEQALVYVGSQSHWLAGSGHYILLKKVNGAWSIDQKVMTWIS